MKKLHPVTVETARLLADVPESVAREFPHLDAAALAAEVRGEIVRALIEADAEIRRLSQQEQEGEGE